MRVPLDTTTREKLEAFALRRRSLIMRRGLCATLFALLLAVTAVALVDFVFVLPDASRWSLSITAYAVVLLVAWFLWIRPLLRAPTLPQLARLIEEMRPVLREDLLSAVELGGEASDEVMDSEEFRGILQASVAGRMQSVEPSALLPPRLIRVWLALACVATVGFVALFAVPELRFGRLVARALLPMANLDRVSRTLVAVLEPNPPDARIPQGDPVSVMVACSGPAPDTVILEAVRTGKPMEPILMEPTGSEGRYRASLQTDENPITYRIRANDAVTRRYTITPRLRPYVTAFDISYEYPAYMSRPQRRDAGVRRGDLTAHAGTTANLTLHTDQPVAEAFVEMEQGGEFSRVPVQVLEPKKLSLLLPMKADGEYKVNLIAADTGFDNGKYSPRYEIKALPDELPVVRIEEPTRDLLVPPDDIIRLAGSATDDVGVARVIQFIKINEGDWQELPLAAATTLPSAAEAAVPVRKSWDLAPLTLKPGDRVLTRLAAFDLRGSKGESAPVRIMVASPGFSPADVQSIVARRRLFDLLRTFEKTVADVQKEAQQAAGSLNPDDAAALAASVQRVRSAAGRVDAESEQLLEAVTEALRISDGGADAWELAILGAAIHRIRLDQGRSSIEAIENALRLDDPNKTREAFNQAAQMLATAANDAREAREAFGEILIADEAALLTNDLVQVEREQVRIDAITGDDETTTQRWTRRQRVALRQMEEMEPRFSDLASRYEGRPAESARKVAERLRALREELGKLAEAPATRDRKNDPERHGRRVREIYGEWNGFVGEQTGKAQGQRQRLDNKAAPLDQLTGEFINRARETADHRKHLAERVKRGDKPEDMAGDRKRLKELEAARDRYWRILTELHEARAKTEEARADADTAFVADLDLMQRALKAMRTKSAEDADLHKALTAVTDAFRVLDAGHRVTEMAAALDAVRSHERWYTNSPDSRTKQTQNVDWINYMTWVVPDRIPQAKLPGEARDRLIRARDAQNWKEVNEQMGKRRWSLEPIVRVHAKVDPFAREAAAARDMLQAHMAEARKVIAAHVPSVSEMMAGLAEKAEKIQEAALQTAGKLEGRAPEETAQATRQLQAEHAELREGIEQVADALRREANLQDTSTDAGRERVRDTDDMVAMMDKPAGEAQQALDQASSTPQKEEKATALADAARREDQLADTLRQLARHQQLLEKGADVAESRAALRQAEREMGLQPDLEQQFAAAQALARLSKMSPQEQLAALEQELQRNPEMRQAFRALAQDAMEQAYDRLQQASSREERVERRLEGPAGEENRRRENLAQRLGQIAQRAQDLSSREFPPIEERAEQGRVQSVPAMVDEAEAAIGEVQQSADAAVEAKSLSALQQAAEQMAKSLSESAKDMTQVRDAGRQAAHQAQQSQDQNVKNRADPANDAANRANSAADQLRSLAQEARQTAQEANQGVPVPGELANSQEPIGKSLDEAAESIEHAAQLESRLASPAAGQALAGMAQEVRGIGQKELPAATEALRKPSAAEAANRVDQAHDAIENQIARLDSPQLQPLAADGGQPGSPEASPSAMAPDQNAAEALARALEQLGQAMTPGEGQPPPQRASNEAAALMRAAAAAQARSMRQGRSGRQQQMARAQTPTSEGLAAVSRSGATAEAPPNPNAVALPEAGRQTPGTWGKLPPKLARDLMEGRREKVADEYRDMVETYFKVIAEKARDESK